MKLPPVRRFLPFNAMLTKLFIMGFTCMSPAWAEVDAGGTGPMQPFKVPRAVMPSSSDAGQAPKPDVKAAPAPKTGAAVKGLVDRMQAFYEKTADFQAQFRQDYTYKT